MYIMLRFALFRLQIIVLPLTPVAGWHIRCYVNFVEFLTSLSSIFRSAYLYFICIPPPPLPSPCGLLGMAASSFFPLLTHVISSPLLASLCFLVLHFPIIFNSFLSRQCIYLCTCSAVFGLHKSLFPAVSWCVVLDMLCLYLFIVFSC
jgi:hypothetical protein